MENLNRKVFGFSLAATSAIIYLICVIAYLTAPNALIRYGNYVFHSIDLGSIAMKSISFLDSLIGLILVIASSYIIGMLFASLYNYFNKKY